MFVQNSFWLAEIFFLSAVTRSCNPFPSVFDALKLKSLFFKTGVIMIPHEKSQRPIQYYRR